LVPAGPRRRDRRQHPGRGAGTDYLDQNADGLTFDRFVGKALLDHAVPGAVVVAVEGDRTVLLKGYGVRSAGQPEPVDQDTRFQVASLSKFLAATALGTLVDDGRLGWDTPLVTYVPALAFHDPYATRHATLRDMLAHRSGLPAYTGDLLTRLGHDAEQALHRLRFLVPDHSFRERWAYSNYGIFVAGIAGARAAGSTKERVVVDRLFAPLGMGRSGPVLAELTKDGNHASGHDIDGTIMPPEDVDAFNGAGAFVSTGADMARWLRMMLAGGSLDGRQVLKPETVEEIYAASMVQGVGGPLQDPNDSAGLGRESYRFLLDRVVEKNGALNGIRTIATLVPEKRIGIMVLANKQLTVFPEAVRAEFLERYLGPSGRDLQAEIRAQQPGWDALVELPAPLATAEPLGRDLGTLAGRYESRLYGPATIAVAGEALSIEFGPNRYAGALRHRSGDSFLLSFPDPDVTPGLVTFSSGPSGEVTGFDGGMIAGAFTIDYGGDFVFDTPIGSGILRCDRRPPCPLPRSAPRSSTASKPPMRSSRLDSGPTARSAPTAAASAAPTR
jgi:CubicO group peptidase (beta-lactamase class C family)